MPRTVFVISQHGYGIGHLTRSCAIADQLAMTGNTSVYLFSGGRPSAGIGVPRRAAFIQLPATEFTRLTGAGTIVPVPVDPASDAAAVEEQRCAILLEHFHRLRPDALLIEYYPFAPERFGNTLDLLLEEARVARHRPRVICSVRTFPTDPTHASAEDVHALLERYFDLVLHHTDYRVYPPQLIGEYFYRAIGDLPIKETGFVSRRYDGGASMPTRRREGFLFTVGGGRDGAGLLESWLEAAAACGTPGEAGITAVCGPFMPSADVERIMEWNAYRGIRVLPALPDEAMAEVMRSSEAVVCMGGYNTLNEALEAGTPTLAFPRNRYPEQLKHVETLARRGLILSGEGASGLEDIARRLGALKRFRCNHTIDFTGAETSARFIMESLQGSRRT